MTDKIKETDPFSEVITDRTSGAQSLTVASGEILASCIKKLSAESPGSEIINYIAKTGRKVVKAHPSIAPLRRLFKSLLLHLEEITAPKKIKVEAVTFIENYLHWLRDIKFRIAGHASLLLASKETILTHSLSTLVFESLREAKRNNPGFRVITTESRPFLEGRVLTRQVSEFEIPVTMIVDAAAPGYVEEADLVLLGADRITQSEFINKIGSLSIVLAAHRLEKPCYVLAGSDKYLSENDEPVTLSRGSGGEVWEKAPQGISIGNPYFERIPLRLITGIICESGIIPYGQFANQENPFSETELIS